MGYLEVPVFPSVRNMLVYQGYLMVELVPI